MLEPPLALARDVSPTGRPIPFADAIFKHEALKPRVLRVEPYPGVPIEGLARVHLATAEV